MERVLNPEFYLFCNTQSQRQSTSPHLFLFLEGIRILEHLTRSGPTKRQCIKSFNPSLILEFRY